MTPKRMTSGGAHLRGLAPEQHRSEEASKPWRAVRVLARRNNRLPRSLLSRGNEHNAMNTWYLCSVWYKSNRSMTQRSDDAIGAEGYGFKSRASQSDTVSAIARHHWDVFPELCCPGAKPRRWTRYSLHASA